ncbi:alkaline phosphatase [Saccharobesus litoralis]|nr:alkaline phosphatase [Saccharobesus litoralis]
MSKSRRLICLIGLFLLTSCGNINSSHSVNKAPKNIILIIGDGMGPTHISAYRYLTEHKSGSTQTVFDKFKLGTASTFPADNTLVTDSAAAATALATGIKTYNGAIAVDKQQNHLTTLFEIAKQHNKQTGLAVTSDIAHATPASFYSHQQRRKQKNEIANWLVDNQTSKQPIVDVILGGGKFFMKRSDRDLIAELQAKGYSYTDNMAQLAQLTKPALGIFHSIGFPSALDSDTQRLSQMTDTALNLLKNSEQGFVLLVEGSQIDWCGHQNDIACLLAEMADFANAIDTAYQFASQRDDTLIVITADHETGGLALASQGKYLWKVDEVAKISMTTKTMAAKVKQGNDLATLLSQHTPFTYSEQEIAQAQSYSHLATEPFALHITKLINKKSNTGFSTTGHSATDVQVFSYGTGSEHFTGFMDNTDIAKKLIQFVKQ